MKKLLLYISILAGFALIFTSCPQPTPVNPEDETLETGLKLDVSKFNVWNDATYDAATSTFSTTKACGSIGLDIDDSNINWSDYNCFKIKYSTKNYGFFIYPVYVNSAGKETNIEFYCPSNMTEFVVPIDSNQDGALKKIKIMGLWNHNINATINSIMLQKRDNPGPSHTYTEPPVTKMTDTGTPKTIDDSLSAWDFLPKMGVGFQYTVCGGFTYGTDFGLDAAYAWGYPIETKETIHAIAEKGFKTLRLQVAGSFHVIDSNYTMDPAFMKQLKKVVDWAIDEGMYVTIVEGCCSYYFPQEADAEKNAWCEDNLFGAGYCINSQNKDRSIKYLSAFWSQIAQAFNNSYDEHLVFEFMNEPINVCGEHQWHPVSTCAQCQSDTEVLNTLNQVCLNTIRSSGGNNAKRYLMVPNLGQEMLYADAPLFKLPDDIYNETNKLIVAVHNYPMGNAPGENGDIKTVYSSIIKNEKIKKAFDAADTGCFSKQIPVAVTETGCSRHTPIAERMQCMKDFMTEAVKDGRSCVVSIHENSDTGDFDYFGYLNKETNTWYENEYIDLILKMAAKKDISEEEEFIEKNKITYESIVGKNLLEGNPQDMKDWSNDYGFKSEIFTNRIPETFKLKIDYTVKADNSSDTNPWVAIQIKYYDSSWAAVSYVTDTNIVSGGSLDPAHDDQISKVAAGNKAVSTENSIIIQFDKNMSENMEGHGLNIQGMNMIVTSVMVVE